MYADRLAGAMALQLAYAVASSEGVARRVSPVAVSIPRFGGRPRGDDRFAPPKPFWSL